MSTRELSETPPLGWMYGRVIAFGLLRRARILGREKSLPELELVLPGVVADPEHEAAYRRVCGFAVGDTLPPSYPHVLAFPVALRLMTDRSFPFPLSGLVHVANAITLHRPIGSGEALTLRVRAERLRPHRKGTQFDIVTEVSVGDEAVWDQVSTYLRRGDHSSSSDAPEDDGQAQTEPAGELRPTATWEVESRVSPRYAAVSGDRNPHHLHPLLARLFGFPRLLAHGMWIKARCLAELADRLPDAFTASVEFKRPMLLPTTVTLATADENGGWSIAVRDAEDEAPHMIGWVGPS